MSIRVVGLGGTYRPHSSTEQALRIALASCAALGAETRLFGADMLDLPMYRPSMERATTPAAALNMIEAVRDADAVIIASPGYHGCISGLVKNALDYLEELRESPKPYLDGKAVGCIATGAGWQATMTTMASLRFVVHALRGWPTPLGVAINTTEATFKDDACSSESVTGNLKIVGEQVMHFARRGAAA